MSGGEYQVSWALQTEASGSVSTAVGGMDQSLQDVNNQVNSLVSTWDSDAREAYTARQAQWTSAADNIKSALMQFQTALSTAADTSQSTEQRNVGVVSG